jgi:hypothetical protein
MGVGVPLFVIRFLSLDDAPRLLRGGGRIEVDERSPLRRPSENRKIFADPHYVHHFPDSLRILRAYLKISRQPKAGTDAK